MKILVTGGAGFIGSAVVRLCLARGDEVVVVDKLTYAGHLENLGHWRSASGLRFEQLDICDGAALGRVLRDARPQAVMHLAAESHVDRLIDGPWAAVETNLVGTFRVLEAARSYWQDLSPAERSIFRLHHVSTDEVYGSLGETGRFTEKSSYDPHSPYAATKAGSDHLVRAWFETYGLPVVISNASNNYGPYQYPEKLIPVLIAKALAGELLPIYGTGANVRDWMYVDDHAAALRLIVERGAVGECYNVGAACERTNLDVARAVCALLDELHPRGRPHDRLVALVADRPGHDHRYALDPGKVRRDLDWQPVETFETGLRKTVEWYLANQEWCRIVTADRYDGRRLGLGPRQ